jgi:hypothetical protein
MKKLLILICLLWNTTSHAEEIENNYSLYEIPIPVICGQSDMVDKFLINEGLTAKTLSLGREGGKKDGSVIFLITHYESLEKSKSAATVQVANSDEACILYFTFDIIDAPKGKGI